MSSVLFFSGITASPESITLREMEPATIPTAEVQLPNEAHVKEKPQNIPILNLADVSPPLSLLLFKFEGEDLIDHHPDTIDFLLAQADHFPEGVFLKIWPTINGL